MFSVPGLRNIWQAVPYLVRFLLVFATVSAGLSLYMRATSPPPDMIVLTPKLAHYTAHADQYDTVFIGTSRTLYHIVPERVERGAAEAGCPAFNAFNMGVHGLNGSEQDWLVAQVLAAGGSHLKNIILEDPLPDARKPGQVMTTRTRYFHGPSDYRPILESVWSFPEILPKRLFRTGIFVYGVLYDLSGIGRVSEALFPGPDPAEPSFMKLSEDGFEALDEVTSDDIEARRQDFLDRADEFADRVAVFDAGASVPNLEARVAYLHERLTALRSHGLTVALYVSPDVMELDRTPLVGMRLAGKYPDIPVLNFNRPDKYPELFRRELWQDYSHFSRQGAEQFSYELGLELCRQLDAGAG